MTLRIPAKVLLHVWSYDFYDMTLSTGKQRRHMINKDKLLYGRDVNRSPNVRTSVPVTKFGSKFKHPDVR